jgi:hypothetical protein
LTPRDNQLKKFLRMTINPAIITMPRHQLAILIVEKIPSGLSRYSLLRFLRKEDEERS